MKQSARRNDWPFIPIKYVASCNDDVLPEWSARDRRISYVDIGNVQHGIGITGYETHTFADAPSRARRLVRDGDVIISTVRTYLRAIARIECPEDDVVVSTGFAVLRPGPRLSPRFFGYAMQSESLIDEIVARSTGVSYPAIAPNELTQIPISVPSVSRQEKIASFLDYETAQSDALIAKYERLLALLDEKRVALITQAVTKGLDPNVPMKDSGVQWIGKIPAHWAIRRLKHIARTTVGIVIEPSQYFSSEGRPFIHGNNIGDGRLLLGSVKLISDADSMRNAKSRLGPGDLVTMRVGEPGRTAVITPECYGGNCASVILIKASGVFDSDWLRFVINSRPVKTQIEMGQNGSAQQVLNVSDAANLALPVPPLHEQRALARMLLDEEERLGDLIARIQRARGLIVERRQALITAAVTGDVDVSAYTPKRSAEIA